QLWREHFVPWGLEVTFADMTDVAAVRAASRPKTRLIWTETPSNPTIAVTDLGAIAAIAKAAGALLACDNTWATPFLQQPFTLGADLVMHSTTKYLSGHPDVMGRARAFDVAARLQLFTRATSLGGPESLVEHRASVEGAGSRAPEGLLRLSIGLEHPDDLIADLRQALGD